ncbi:hypothetical protein GTP91_24830 [Rugamonas sp. FT82W]|uniref:Fimbrial assembly protein n=1 Tax=Duganella vulcania TaxID=2692166 RepID=A0A845G7W6_9BURK|nr:PilN domain-containing protein [Duganella vulcania]MYM90384.1 hypothetical protein [Duganella vulcania]
MTRASLPAVALAFVAPPGWSHFAGWIALASTVTMASVLGWTYQRDQAALAAARSALAETRIAQKRLATTSAVSKESLEHTQKQIGAAQGVIRRLNLPWDDLFSTLEASIGDDVVLIDVEPDPEAHTIVITAEARTPQAMLDYGQNLAGSALLTNAFIQSHQVLVQAPQKPLRFTIAAQWLIPTTDSKPRAGGLP